MKPVRKNTPESAGSEYATDQLQSDYFMEWVRDQMLEASKADPSEMLPLETKADAMVIAKNMLQQLEWDTKRGLDSSEIMSLIGSDSAARRGDTEIRPALYAEFYDGFRKTIDASRDWLADELLQIKGEMGDGSVVRTSDQSFTVEVLGDETGRRVKWRYWDRTNSRSEAESLAINLWASGEYKGVRIMHGSEFVRGWGVPSSKHIKEMHSPKARGSVRRPR